MGAQSPSRARPALLHPLLSPWSGRTWCLLIGASSLDPACTSKVEPNSQRLAGLNSESRNADDDMFPLHRRRRQATEHGQEAWSRASLISSSSKVFVGYRLHHCNRPLLEGPDGDVVFVNCLFAPTLRRERHRDANPISLILVQDAGP